MPALTLNGISLPVAQGSWKQQVQGADWESTLARGVRLVGRTRKRRWSGALVPRSLEEATALRGLLSGAGHHWGFEDTAYSDSGLGAAPSSGTPQFVATGFSGDVPRHPLLLTFGVPATDYLEYPLAKGADWTAFGYGHVGKDYGWSWRGMRSDGARWLGAARDDAQPYPLYFAYTPGTGVLRLQSSHFGAVAWANSQVRALGSRFEGNGWAAECIVAGTTAAAGGNPLSTGPAGNRVWNATFVDGTVTWRTLGPTGCRLSDLVWVPYKIPDAWVAPLVTWHDANPWSALPKLVASGDLLGGASVSVIGVDEEGEGLVGNVGSGRQQLERFSFILQEL